MRRALSAMVVTLAVLAPSAAQAAETRVRSVEAFRVDDRVVLHVVVAHPDRRVSDLRRGARHDGRVELVVRDGAGRELATRRARAELPPAVPRARAVRETYRFGRRGDRATGAGVLDVDVTASSRLDPDGRRGDASPATETTTFADEVRVAEVPDEPAVWQYVGLFASTGPFCDLDDDTCGTTFGSGPYADLSDWFGRSGSIDVNPGRDGRQQLTFAISGEFLRGTTDAGLGSADFVVTDGLFSKAGTGRISGGTRDVAGAGEKGGPLHLNIWRTTFGGHNWALHGYVKAG